MNCALEASLAKHSASISVEETHSWIVAVVGHYDCAGNPGDKSHHYVQIAERLCKRYLYGNSLQKSLVSMLTTTGKLKKSNKNFSNTSGLKKQQHPLDAVIVSYYLPCRALCAGMS